MLSLPRHLGISRWTPELFLCRCVRETGRGRVLSRRRVFLQGVSRQLKLTTVSKISKADRHESSYASPYRRISQGPNPPAGVRCYACPCYSFRTGRLPPADG